MDGTNHGIPISQTPINKKKVIPNTRPETNNLKEENQYGPQVQALELTLMNQANVTINKAQKITYGMTNGEIDLSEGYIAKLQERAAKKLEGFMKEMRGAIVHQPLLHWEDTVIMVNTQRSCLRFYGTEKLVMYTAHEKKDKGGLDEDNNIDDFIKFTNKAEEIDEIINYANFEIKSHFSDEELMEIIKKFVI